MGEINRRALIGAAGAAGATVALSACSTRNGSNGNSKMRAPYPQHGDDPHDKVGSKFPSNANFKPDYVCAVYIRYHADATMTVRHGYFDLSKPTTDMSEERIAAKLLRAAADAKTSGDWKAIEYGHARKEVNFENFSFGRPMRVYLLVDNDHIRFDDRKDSNGVYRNLLRFTQFRIDTGKQRKNGDFELVEAAENHAFFDATLVELAEFKNRRLLRIDNHYTDEKGDPISAKPEDPTTHHLYSINFHLLWTTADASGDPPTVKEIPMVIDPDGGNMGSQP